MPDVALDAPMRCWVVGHWHPRIAPGVKHFTNASRHDERLRYIAAGDDRVSIENSDMRALTSMLLN